MLYVKEGLHYKRREDLELSNIENIWIEFANCRKHILVDIYYRPPNSDAFYIVNIEDSIGLAIDTGISEVIITDDFNLNFLRLLDKFVLYVHNSPFFNLLTNPRIMLYTLRH